MSTLENNTTTIDELITMANNLPDAGGGGSVETCTVTINHSSQVRRIAYMTLDDSGKFSTRYITDIVSNLTLTDVVCNSVMTISYNSYMAMASLTNGTILDQITGSFSAVSIDAQAGGTVTVNIVAAGGGGAE